VIIRMISMMMRRSRRLKAHHFIADDPRNGRVGCSCEIRRDHTWAEFTATGEVIYLEGMSHAETKALFAQDGTFNIESDGRVSL